MGLNKIFKCIIHGEKGQSLVETVIVLPLILLILFSIISVGFYVYDLTVFTMASNKGLDARLGVIANPDITEKDKLVEEKAEKFAEVAIFVDNIKASSYDDPESKTVTVYVEGDFKCILPFVNDIFKDSFHIKSNCAYVYEGTT